MLKFSKWMILVVGFSIASPPIGCASVKFEERQVQTTRHSQDQPDQRNSGTRSLNSEVCLNYEANHSFSGHLNKLLEAQVNSEIYGGFLASTKSRKKIPLPSSFEECEGIRNRTPVDQRPKPRIYPGSGDTIDPRFSFPCGGINAGTNHIAVCEDTSDGTNHMGIVAFTMDASSGRPGRNVVKLKSLSLPGPNKSILNLKHEWFYEPPIGSKVNQGIINGKHFVETVDTMGEYILALRVEDESGACAVKVWKILSTANVPYLVPRFSRKSLHQDFNMNYLTSYLDQIEGRESWKHSQGEGVTIAVLDSGLNYNHPLVAHNVKVNKGEIPGNGIDDDQNGYVDDYTGYDFFHDDPYPFDDRGHGSLVAGLAASAIGLAPKARVLPVKVSAFGTFAQDRLISAIYYAVDSGAQIINISLGIHGLRLSLRGEAKKSIAHARTAGVLIVAAAGNDGRSNKDIYPASYPSENIISVGGVDQNGSLRPTSNWGEIVDIAAPGYRLQSLGVYNPTFFFSSGKGTSMAAPIVSGLAAQILSINPRLSPKEVIDIIMSTGDHSPSLEGKVKSARVINALNAVLAAKNLRPSLDVYKLQIDLMRHCSSLPSNFADRRFGPATRAALKQFQASYGLTPDGIYGPETADALSSPVTGACK